jgi:hypothetical protein
MVAFAFTVIAVPMNRVMYLVMGEKTSAVRV